MNSMLLVCGAFKHIIMFTKHIHFVSKSLPKSVRCIVDEVLISRSIFMNIGPSYSALSCESSYLKSYQNNANIAIISEVRLS